MLMIQHLMSRELTQAAKEGDVVTLRRLVRANPDIVYSVTTDQLNTPLHIAASNGHVEFVEDVLLYMNRTMGIILSENSDGDTPLHVAVRAGHLGVVEHLIHYLSEIEANLKVHVLLICILF